MLMRIMVLLLIAISSSLTVNASVEKAKKEIKTKTRYDKYSGLAGSEYFDQDSNVVFETEFFWENKIIGRYFDGRRCTTEIVYASYGSAVITYEYDKAGHLTKKYIAAYPQFPLDDMKKVNVINRDNLIYKNRSELFNDSIVQILLKSKKKYILEDYQYNVKGQLIYDSLRYIDQGKTRWHKYAYNEQGQVKSMEWNSGYWSTRVEYSYNATGQKIGRKEFNNEGMATNWEDYFYGADGRLSEIHGGTWPGGAHTETRTYYEGLLIMSEYRNTFGELNILNVYGYNEYGYLTEHLFLNPGVNSNWQALSWHYEYY
jgi:hypothetical protein